MPTYQYACTACREQLEVVQSFSDEALTTCPICAGRLRKVFSPVGIVFKGSGFYRNDSREKAGSGAKSGGDGAADSGDTSSKSAESTTSSSDRSSAAKSSSSNGKSADSGKAAASKTGKATPAGSAA